MRSTLRSFPSLEIFSAVDGELDGALEEGLEAPPEEEGLIDGGIEYGDDGSTVNVEGKDRREEEDLSYASMFSHVLGAGDGVGGDEEKDGDDIMVALVREQERESKLRGATAAGGGAVDTSGFLGGSIALGGLLAASTPTEQAFAAGPGKGMSGDVSRGVLEPQLYLPPQDVPDLRHPHLPDSAVGGMGDALTPQELEAQLRGSGSQPPLMQSPGMGGLGPGQSPIPAVQLQQRFHQQSPVQPGVQQGVFTPEMIMQQQQQQRQQMRAPPPPPQHTQSPMPPPQQAWQGRPVLTPPRPQSINLIQARPVMDQRHDGRDTLAQRLRALNLAEPQAVASAPPMRRGHSSRYMSKGEIESILYMQWKPLHLGAPYMEDYYFQAFLDRYYEDKNKKIFAPESGELRHEMCCVLASFTNPHTFCHAVRELAPTEKVAAENIAFVKLEGLGRVAFSNVRRPRPLMEVSMDGSGQGNDGDEPQSNKRRLEQEPALAARIMTEDCMALILDIQDVDRIFIASGGEGIENEDALRLRRTLLAEGLASSLRLSETPNISSGSDGVFLRLLELNKGKCSQREL